jgi:hypothetical protein
MVQAPDARDAYLYRTLLVRAAPGALLEVIDLYRDQMPTYEAAGERPFIMRHSQGDQWDLLLLFPMGSFADYYSPSSIARRARAWEASGISGDEFQQALDERIAWREELFALGPSVMFIALPGLGFLHDRLLLGPQALRGERRYFG